MLKLHPFFPYYPLINIATKGGRGFGNDLLQMAIVDGKKNNTRGKRMIRRVEEKLVVDDEK